MRVEDRARWVGGGRTALERIVDGLLCDGGELGGGHVGDGDDGDSLEVGVVVLFLLIIFLNVSAHFKHIRKKIFFPLKS